MKIREFQDLIERLYGAKDRVRGVPATFQWFTEEVGELARAIRKGRREDMEEEFADVLAWLSTLANMCDVDLTEAAALKYPGQCTKCNAAPCACIEARATGNAP